MRNNLRLEFWARGQVFSDRGAFGSCQLLTLTATGWEYPSRSEEVLASLK